MFSKCIYLRKHLIYSDVLNQSPFFLYIMTTLKQSMAFLNRSKCASPAETLYSYFLWVCLCV